MSLRDRLRVMVVDDMSTSRAVLMQALDALGISNVTSAPDSRSALGAIDRAPVHLVISDYNMPGENGLCLLGAMRHRKRSADTRFILMTGSDAPDIIDRGRGMGMNGYLLKPYSIPQLRTSIEAVVGRL